MEDTLIKRISGGIMAVRTLQKSPLESGVASFLNKLKVINQFMYEDLLQKYKAALETYKASGK